MTWPIHPAANLFPMLPASELQALADDIKANGQHEPAVVFDGQVIDGRNRIAACALAGVEPRVRTMPSCPDPVAYVLSLNLHRRHLDESQRGIVAAKARALFAEQAKARQVAHLRRGENEPDPVSPNLGSREGKAADQAAAMLNVGRGTVEAASKVLKHGVPELVEAVERGQVAVSAAAAVATLPAEEQREVVAGGKEAMREKAKAVRAAKAKAPTHPVLAEIEQATDLAALDRAFNKVAGAGLSEADAEAAGEAYRRRKATLRAPVAAAPVPPPAPSQASATTAETVAASKAEWDALQAEVAGLRQWQESVARRAGAGDPATVQRVMGLIALTRNPNEHEAASAALNACRMIRERGLTVATSVQPSTPPEVSVELLEQLRKEEADFWAGMHRRFDDVLGRRSS